MPRKKSRNTIVKHDQKKVNTLDKYAQKKSPNTLVKHDQKKVNTLDKYDQKKVNILGKHDHFISIPRKEILKYACEA